MRLSNPEIEVYMGNFNPMYVTFGIYLIAVLLIGMAAQARKGKSGLS